MTWRTIVSIEELARATERIAIFDCRYDLTDPDAGLRAYESRHIRGAVYLDLERDLSGKTTGSNGRHPLPEREVFARRLREAGLDAGMQAIAYDASGGIFAARLWWMMRWLGHDKIAVLDNWDTETAQSQEVPEPREGSFVARAPLAGYVGAETILAGDVLVVDARSAERFGGAPHPLDTKAGHIPGAVNRFYGDNLDAAGRFRPADELRAEWEAILGRTPPELVVSQCGSGVTAAHNLLAMEIAGLTGARLYPGSWSEWVSDPTRPIEAS